MNDFAATDEDVDYAVNVSSLDDHWNQIIAGGFNSAIDNYAEDAVLELPQADRVITGRDEIRKYRAARVEKIVKIERIRGRSDVWITEYLCNREQGLCHVVSIMECRDGKICLETEYVAERPPGANQTGSVVR